jgi:hypothetical protein
MFYEIVSAMQLSEINRGPGSVHLRVVPHCVTLVMSEGVEDKEQASEVTLTPGDRDSRFPAVASVDQLTHTVHDGRCGCGRAITAGYFR